MRLTIAFGAFLPSFLFGHLLELLGVWVVGTGLAAMPFRFADRAYFGLAFAATSIPTAMTVRFDLIGSNPGTACLHGTVESILGFELQQLFVPLGFERRPENLADVFQCDRLVTTLRRHELRVGRAQFEDPAEAIRAHVMFAFQLCKLRHRKFFQAGRTFHLLLWLWWWFGFGLGLNLHLWFCR